MLNSKHLSLKLVRLKPKEEWVNDGKGLSFIFPKGGVGSFVLGPTVQRLAPGDILVLSLESKGKLSVPIGSELVFWEFSAAFENLFPLFASSEICLLQDVTEGLKDFRIHSGMKSLAKDCHKLLEEIPSEYNLEHRGQLLRVVGAILTEEFKKARGERVGFVRAEDHLIQVFEKLSMDELLTASVDELAVKFSCSRRHLSRLFHQHFGFSVAALRMEMRLLKAVSLLKNPVSKIINVAEESGFNHLGLFNTCFKNRFGASPGQWRKQFLHPPERDKSTQDKSICPLRGNGLCPMTGMPELREKASGGGGAGEKTAGTRLPNSNGGTVMGQKKVEPKLAFRVRFQPRP